MANRSVLRMPRSVYLESKFFPPLFLAPALQTNCLHPQRPPSQTPSNTTFFTTSASSQARHLKRDKNRSRGVSAIRRTGPRHPLTISKYLLPEPVDNPPARKQFQIRPDHGLWGFFNKERTPMSLPEDLDAHGRHWTTVELAKKSWEDLRTIWWGCLKEKNWLSTDELERKRVEAGYGDFESQERVETINKTMKNIRKTLLQRIYAWEEAILLADSPNFWRERLIPKEQEKKRSKFPSEQRDDVLERLESGRPMVDDGDVPRSTSSRRTRRR